MKGEILIRLNKYLAHANIGTRRECDKLIEAGFIKVNDAIVSKTGYKIRINDKVLFKGQLVQVDKKVYILLNKPKNISSLNTDNITIKSIFYLTHSFSKKLELGYAPVIKPFDILDINERGLTLLTNDETLLTKLKTSSKLQKIYHIVLDKELSVVDFVKLEEKYKIKNNNIQIIELSYLKDKKNIGLNIQSNTSKEIHDLFEKLKYKIEYLDRTVLAGLNKKDLPRGRWRFLNPTEILRLTKFF